ncbi:hypothetical protein TraAM80_05017 [Trypanosoma rangeli]|uniref:EDRF1 N-terminal domain-containing protein n=1 Tax=Trypanosoma rangeli TaxID=5698 RepID=A0A3R7MEZ3_TRYRA|nr:uncharacterized protein TraAM80_05017 [Trypanosoma rangeli]RNF04614.1 hypothetical protein TraAM80_05017 [Trypanosoma rangeli]|eukprot:RNF04614.1 hypothetical protein TraAM80_05017 [Trypanosoma rangeli]
MSYAALAAAGKNEDVAGNADGVSHWCGSAGSSAMDTARMSRRALHRKAVKKFNERRKKEEQKRLAEARDGNLLSPNETSESNRGGSERSATSNHDGCVQVPAVALSHAGSLAKPALIHKWEFDFFFRTVPSELLQTCAESMNQDGAPPPPPASSSLYTAEEQSLVVLKDDKQRNPGGSMPLKTLMQSSITKSIHVRRVEGVPPLPMTRPMQPGTDLDQPTWNYLLPDTTYNVHQHAPGFERDENAAKRSLLSCAVQEWRGGEENVLLLSTGETLRSVFESTYYPEKPLALEVRRMGPTLLIDSHSAKDFSTRVRDMREKALLGKALYRIHNDVFSRMEMNNVSYSAAGGGVVTLPTHRVGSLALLKETRTLSRYSHILSWEIGLMEVLVGIDTPIVIDRRDNTESVLKLEDTSVVMTPQEIQRDALRCWFDATLANVPQVGIYVHNDGIIKRYEVRKVQELLGIVEGNMATAAMNFTMNVLQWLVKQCGKDGMTYAVIRNYESGLLEIYEYSRDERLEKFLPEDAAGEGESTTNAKNKAGSPNDSGKEGVEENIEASKTKEELHAEENERLNWGLATMCFRMGMHLKDSETKAPDALSLLLRSFAVYFMQRAKMDEACNHVCKIVKCLPGLIGRMIDTQKAALEEEGGIIQLPELYREALLTCGRFEVRLQEAAYDEALCVATRRAFLRCLLPCSAAVCVCVARAMEQFAAERRVYMRLRTESNRGSNVHIHSLIAKDLLQVVVEGLLRLEQMSRMLKSDAVLTQGLPLATNNVETLALVDTRTDLLNVTPLEATLWELYTDVVLLVMSDRTPFTAEVLLELSRRIKAREEARLRCHRRSSSSSSSGNSGEHKNDCDDVDSNNNTQTSVAGESTLAWLSAITPDVVSLSFTALRFLTKVGLQSKRLLSKTAQVYYHVGHHYFLTDRYTKALESLHRAQSLFNAMQQAPAGTVFGECCISSATVTIRDVQQTLGEVYVRMTRLKSRVVPAEMKLSLQRPLLMGEVRALSQEEENFFRHAVDAFTNCEAKEQLASVLRTYAARQISHIAFSGQQADVAKGRHIFSMLRKSAELSFSTDEVDWEVLRLFTCAAHHAALQHRAEQIVSQWTTHLGTAEGASVHMPLKLMSSVHPVESALQLALVFLSQLETKRNANTHQAMRLVRGCAAHVVIAIHDAHAASKSPGALLVRAASTWKARCTHEWVCYVAMMISLRAMRALVRLLPGEKASEAKQLLRRLICMEESKHELQAKSEVCVGKCHFSCLSETLVESLEGVAKW